MALNDKSQFLAVLAYGRMSALELASVKSANISEFDIIQVGDSAVLIECCLDTARTLARRLGGTYKIVAVCCITLRDLVQNL